MAKKRSNPNSEMLNQACTNKRQALSQLKRRMRSYELKFRTNNQKAFYETIQDKELTFCAGPAGSGKTYIAVAFALQALAERGNHVDGIIITKPLVEAAGEKIGFLPGDIDEKTDPFMMSYWCNMEKLIGKDVLEVLTYTKVIEVIPMAYMRGVTLDNKIVILDEAQNATTDQMKMLLTRIGEDSKYIICGDIEQTDRKGGNGLLDGLLRFANTEQVGISTFGPEDIVRNPLISVILDQYKLEIHPDDLDLIESGGDGSAHLIPRAGAFLSQESDIPLKRITKHKDSKHGN
tara:strand:- start:8642 stop:9514 length:873 start_codon:yes stop_codon:yes gene_type:complete